MSTLFGQNAIAWGHFQLRGGLRNVLLTALAYGIGIGGLIYLSIAFDKRFASRILTTWATGLLVLQTLILGVFGCSTVTGALRQDVNTGMLESHRLMPVQPHWAIVGYLVGASCQALALAAANFVIGLSVCHGAGIQLEQWFVSNAILIFQALFLWSVLLCLTFQFRNSFWLVFFAVALSIMTQGTLFTILPAGVMLLSVFMSQSVFTLNLSIGNMTQEFAIAAMAQLVVGAIFFVGSMRKYRRPDQSALGVIPGLLLLAAWVAASVIAIGSWHEFRPQMWRTEGAESAQFITSTLLAMLLAIIPIANSARLQSQWKRKLRLHDPAGNPRPLPALFIAVSAAALMVCLCKSSPSIAEAKLNQAVIRTAIVIGAFALAISYFLRIFYRAGIRARLLAGIYLAVTWIGPVVLDLVRYTLSDNMRAEGLELISTASPIGALYQVWYGRFDTTGGLAVQCLLAVVAAVLFYSTERTAPAKAPLAPPPLPPKPPTPSPR